MGVFLLGVRRIKSKFLDEVVVFEFERFVIGSDGEGFITVFIFLEGVDWWFIFKIIFRIWEV